MSERITTRSAFEETVLRLWMETRIPLTVTNLQYFTKAKRSRIETWFEELAVEGMLDTKVTDVGDIHWCVQGGTRPDHGPKTVEAYNRLRRLESEVEAEHPPSSDALVAERGSDRKSVVVSSVLSLFLGPLGWIYAAPMKEAIPLGIVYLAIGAVVPHALWVYMLSFLLPVTAIFGGVYAWLYNKHGERMTLLLPDDNEA